MQGLLCIKHVKVAEVLKLNLYMEAEKWYQEWVSEAKAYQMAHKKPLKSKGLRRDNC